MATRPGHESVITRAGSESLIATHSVLRNTYLLLAITLTFSACVATASMALKLPYLGPIVTLIGFWGLSYVTYRTSHSAMGLFWTFVLTGFMGYTLGPILNAYLSHYVNGGQLVTMSLAGTAGTFFLLSAYTLITRKDMSFLGGFITVGFFVLLALFVVSLFTTMPMLTLVFSGLAVLFASAIILYETSSIIHGGETNYIRATVSLYSSIYMLFLHLLNLFTFLNGEE